MVDVCVAHKFPHRSYEEEDIETYTQEPIKIPSKVHMGQNLMTVNLTVDIQFLYNAHSYTL